MNLKQSIQATLAYHDIFNYPLTESEIHAYLIGNKSSLTHIKSKAKLLVQKKIIGKRREFYFLSKRKNLPALRIMRKKISQEKLKRAIYFATVLRLIPSIELVAISGALSMANSTKSDDIDLVIITSKNTLWITRFLANFVLLPYKRSPKSKIQKDKACLNIFIDKKALKITDENLYTAHEICQMKPIWDRGNSYQKFIRTNNWVKQYLPNWEPSYMSNTIRSTKYKLEIITGSLSLLEKLAKMLQLKYMHSKITNEKIGEWQLFFHPDNNQSKILATYTKKLLALKIKTS